jgi:hypothetical protein
MAIRLEFKPQDCWIGIFWKTTRGHAVGKQFNPWSFSIDQSALPHERIDVWVCILPMLPIHVWWTRPIVAWERIEEAKGTAI